MAVNQSGNQFVFPNKADPTDPLNLEVLERWVNTQVVNRIEGASSRPVLGIQGTGIVTLPSTPSSGAVTLIETITVAADGDQVDFLLIPATFQQLLIIGSLVGNGSYADQTMGLQFSGVVAASYDGWYTLPSGGSVVSSAYTGATSILCGEVTGSADPQFPFSAEAFVIWVPNYAAGKWLATMLGASSNYSRGYDFGGSLASMSASVVTEVRIETAGGFQAGGEVSLYGIAG
jgi:hypothetical protein